MDLSVFVIALESPALYTRGDGVPSLTGLVFVVLLLLLLAGLIVKGANNQWFEGISNRKKLGLVLGGGIWVAMIAGVIFGG
jgi:hypothetical protein